MRNQIKFVALTAMLSLPVGLLAAESSWYNPKSWFNKDDGEEFCISEESIKDQVIFKTFDGQTLLLIGNKAADVGKCGTEAKIRVFGNVYKPSDKYPTGALQVRNYRVLDEAAATTPIVATDDKPSTEEATPEPYEEPSLESAPEVAEETTEVAAAPQAEETVVELEEEKEEPAPAPKAAKTYVVQSGDTLGKISSKLFGTTTKWKKIAEANGITNPKHLKVGMTLKVPEL